MATNYNYTENGRVYPFDDVFVRKSLFGTFGQLWSWGEGLSGRLGVDDTNDRSTPVQEFTSTTSWKQVSAATDGDHTAAVKTDGTLWLWGLNSNTQLGVNDNTQRLTPVQEFSSSTNWKFVSGGLDHTAAIKADGTLWCWGNNSIYGLGVGDNADRSTPVQEFTSSTTWNYVACSGSNANSTFAIKTDGTLWFWGFGSISGTNDTTNRSTPMQVGADTTWKQISVGNRNVAAVKTDGTLWVWGFNNIGDLGLNDNTQRLTPTPIFGGGTTWKQVSCGMDGSQEGMLAAVKTDGTLWAWGQNTFGQLGVNDNLFRSTPIQVGSDTTWKQVSCGVQYMAAIKTDGTLWSWGNNGSSRLGVNDGVARSTPVQEFSSSTVWSQVSTGTDFTVAIKNEDYPILY